MGFFDQVEFSGAASSRMQSVLEVRFLRAVKSSEFQFIFIQLCVLLYSFDILLRAEHNVKLRFRQCSGLFIA
jgi:hypothetical protein